MTANDGGEAVGRGRLLPFSEDERIRTQNAGRRIYIGHVVLEHRQLGNGRVRLLFWP